MSEHFPLFATRVHAQYDAMTGHELFVVDTEDLFATYLKAFPEGTNPMYVERTEHDCSCCKAFIRNIGNVVAIKDGVVQTVWDDSEGAPYPYNVVGKALADLVRQAPIKSVWRTKEGKYGNLKTAQIVDGATTRIWDHFEGLVPRRQKSASPDTARGDLNTTAHVLRRGLQELTLDALDTVLDLIAQNNLYKGQEFQAAIKGFRALKQQYEDSNRSDAVVWANLDDRSARFRNSAIGTLITDLSEGMDLEKAVRRYDDKVAPTNYKRNTALITPKMIDLAMATLTELNLEPALARRMARIEDVSVNNVLWVDTAAKPLMRDGVAGILMQEVKAPVRKVDVKEATPISGEDFIRTILPNVTSMQLLIENRHQPNFVTLTTAVDPEAGRVFKWDNPFAWSYDGDVTDSIKERVKKAGGNVDAELRVSLAWYNTDDLDIHCAMPDGRTIYYGSKQGILDVDANNGNLRTDPVENMQWRNLPSGVYKFTVNQYARRNSQNIGYALEVEAGGKIWQFKHPTAAGAHKPALDITVLNGKVTDIKVHADHSGGGFSAEKWGIATESLVPVETFMASPNHWDGQDAGGNLHWMFFLKGCKNPEPVRGIYNEFLRGDLAKHGKVFEVLAAKTKAPSVDNQLSGVGFSSTRKDSVIAVVKGPKINQAFNIQF